MRRWSFPVFLVAASCLALPTASDAQGTAPSLILKENCSQKQQGVQVYGVTLGVTGFPPNTEVVGNIDLSIINPDGSISPGGGFDNVHVTTDASGTYTNFFGLTGTKAIFTLTVSSPYLPGGVQSKTARVTCEPKPTKPTNVGQCKRGGYRSFGFKNHGQCVAFVRRGPRKLR